MLVAYIVELIQQQKNGLAPATDTSPHQAPFSMKAHSPAWAPPNGFSGVVPGIYRSAYPTEANVPYLRNRGIRTVVLLSIETLPFPVRRLLTEGTPANASGERDNSQREPMRIVQLASLQSWFRDTFTGGDDFSERDVQRALDVAAHAGWHPVLFACPTGGLQTSVVVGCLRRYQGWALTSIFSECELFTTMGRPVPLSVMEFIDAWAPQRCPLNETDVLARLTQVELHLVTTEAAARRRMGAQRWRATESSSGSDGDPHGRGAAAGQGEEESSEDEASHWHQTREEEAIMLSSTTSSGRRPPVVRRRVAAKSHAGPSPAESPTAGEGGEGHRVPWASWYVEAMQFQAARLMRSDVLASESDPPHVRYHGVRHPPALDERSCYTKDSIVDEDYD